MSLQVGMAESGQSPEGGQSMALERRQAQMEATLRTVQLISGLAGKGLEVESVADPHLITNTPGVYVFGNHLGSEDQIEDVTFSLRRMLLSGAADSAHSVLAGDLDVEWKTGDSKKTKVAAKCYAKRTEAERFERAIREVVVMEDLSDSNELAMEPIAIAIAPHNHPMSGEVILLTRYEDDLLSLDNIAWGRGLSNKKNMDTARLGVQALGRFNAEFGYRHGDAKIKNAAVKYGNGAGMIDYETTVEFDHLDPFEVATTVEVDFGLMIDSLGKKGLFPLAAHSSRADRRAVVRSSDIEAARNALDVLAFDYLTPWSDHPDDVQMAATNQVSKVIDDYLDSQLGLAA